MNSDVKTTTTTTTTKQTLVIQFVPCVTWIASATQWQGEIVAREAVLFSNNNNKSFLWLQFSDLNVGFPSVTQGVRQDVLLGA